MCTFYLILKNCNKTQTIGVVLKSVKNVTNTLFFLDFPGKFWTFSQSCKNLFQLVPQSNGTFRKVASGSMFALTKHHIVGKSSDTAAAGFWEDFFSGREGWSVCAHMFCEPDILLPLFTPSTSGARNVWSASYAGRLCQHSRQTEEEKEEEVGDRE